MKQAVGVLRKFLALALGIPIVIIGIILVPLPGPGLLVMLFGLLILSWEFDWAKRHSDNMKGQLKKVIDRGRAKPKD